MSELWYTDYVSLLTPITRSAKEEERLAEVCQELKQTAQKRPVTITYAHKEAGGPSFPTPSDD